MKRIVFILSCFIAITHSSCSKSDVIPNIENHQSCIDFFLAEYEMNQYNGESIPCGNSYLVLFEADESKFALLHNDCADLLAQIVKDCAGNELCTYISTDGCFDMVQAATRIGIIGVVD